MTEPTARLPEPDARLTSITLGTNLHESQFAPLGVPFVDGNPVVTKLEVMIFAGDTPLKFDTGAGANEGSYTYNPGGIPEGAEGTILSFPSDESVTVILPTGTEYTFKTSGKDTSEEWVAYGETTETVTVSINSVKLTLKTLLNAALIGAEASQYLVAPGETLDFYLQVLSPGN